ncbi:hypothetical protein [Chryseobacterium sp. YR221]|uniref:hypothetical protein n=1 Tax=Chryseobacterium sp. YR221 TaxID=1500293 RepID=UPI0009D88E9D|nr:hypothetical protein [Chryseobacterium sp. YR221]SMC38267.1 hypothetical protein SAMN02787074_0809 [Chryseobacterium sp. YR221]
MRNKTIKNSLLFLAIIPAVYTLYTLYKTHELNYLSLIVTVLLPIIAGILPNYTKTNHVFKIEHSSWTPLPDNKFQIIIPFKKHGIENPKAVLYAYIDGNLSSILGSVDVTPNHDIIVNINRETRKGEVRITA